MTANNKYVNDYDSIKESNYIMYVDGNNLYNYAMSHANFKGPDNCDDFNATTAGEDSEFGYILEVDL